MHGGIKRTDDNPLLSCYMKSLFRCLLSSTGRNRMCVQSADMLLSPEVVLSAFRSHGCSSQLIKEETFSLLTVMISDTGTESLTDILRAR